MKNKYYEGTKLNDYKELVSLYKTKYKSNIAFEYKKFKSDYYNFLASLEENNQSLKNYTDTQPKEMLKSNDNFMHSLKTIEKGGTYSQREVEFNKNELDLINNDIIIKNTCINFLQ